MYNKTELKNGVRIVTERLEHFRSVSLGIWVCTGSRDEDEKKNGISHFIEHMIFKGTGNLTNFQIAKILDSIGGLSNAFTGKEYTCFHSKVLDKHFNTLGEILSDIFLNSVFDPDNVDKERQVILQEINMVEDSPEDQIHELFNSRFWPDHPLGMSVLGTGKTVSAINRQEIMNHIKDFYTPERIIIAATGNVQHEDVVGFFKPMFESLQPSGKKHDITSPDINPSISCYYKDLEQVNICLGGKAPHLTSDLRFAGAILNTILGGNMSSRLFQEIREKRGLAYSIYSFLSSYMDAGITGICAGTDSRFVNETLEVINDEILKIQDGDISETDLKEAMEHLGGGILLGAESSDARMMRLAKNEFVFGRYITYEELMNELEKVTIDEVVTCSKEAFSPENISLVTLGPMDIDDLELKGALFKGVKN